MSTIRAVVMHQAGSIPGIAGLFGGGQTVYVDMETMQVVSVSPILQQPDNPQPLCEPAQNKATTAKARKASK